jgi:hypothetical protein
MKDAKTCWEIRDPFEDWCSAKDLSVIFTFVTLDKNLTMEKNLRFLIYKVGHILIYRIVAKIK